MVRALNPAAGSGVGEEPSARSVGSIAFSGEPGSFAEDAVLAAFGDVERVGVAGFPAVFEKDWCGDHKIDEAKI